MRAKYLDLPTVKFCVEDASHYNEPMDVVVVACVRDIKRRSAEP